MVAADSRAPRDGKFLEIVSCPPTKGSISHGLCQLELTIRAMTQVGTYNPIANRAGIKEIRLKVDRLRYWISVGAQPSDRVAWILGKFGILPPPPQRFSVKKMIPKKDINEDN